MSKNMTRKGLAFGAGVSLLGASLVGLPAQAANAELITLNPSAGTGFSTLAGSTFTLSTSIDSSVATGSYTYLRYQVENPDQEPITFAMTGGGANSNDDTSITTSGTSTTTDAAGYEVLSIATDTLVYDANGGAGAAGSTTAALVTIDTTASHNLIAGQEFTLSGLGLVLDDTADDTKTDAKVDLLVTELNATHVVKTKTDADTFTFEVKDVSDEDYGSGDFDGTGGTETFADVLSTTNGQNDVSTSDDFVVEPGASDSGAAGSPMTLALTSGTLDSETQVTVTAFIDLDGSNDITDGEVVSAPIEVTFVPASEAIGSISIRPISIGDTTVYANVSFAGDINVRQIEAGDVKVQFSGAASSANVSASWVSTTIGYAAALSDTVQASDSYTAKLTLDQNDNGTVTVGDDATEEDSDTLAAGTAEADVFTVSLVTGDGVSVTTVAREEASTGTAADLANGDDFVEAAGVATVREETSSVTVTGFVGTDAVIPLAVKNKPVQLTVTPSGVTASDKFTVDGEQVSQNVAYTAYTTTDKNGNWTLDLGTAGLDATDTVKVKVASVDGVAGFSGTDGELTITVAASDYTLLDVTDVTGEAIGTIEEGATVSKTYRMVDQWGDAPDNGDYRVAISDLVNNRATTDADFAVSGSVVDGLVTLSFNDNGEGTGYTTVRAQFGPTAGALSSSAGDYVDTKFYVVEDASVDTITLDDLAYGSAQYAVGTTTDNRKKLLLETESFGAYDANLAVPGAAAPEVDSTYAVTVAGTVANADEDGLDGASVTISASGMQFLAGSVYAVDSITFLADGDGDFTVDVWSQTGGTRVVTITAGGKTETVSLPYAGAAAGSEDSLTVASLSSVTPGTTANVVATVKDDQGNGVKGVTVMFSTTIGYMAQAEVTTDANGVAVGKLVTAVNDSGSATVLVSVDNDDVAAVTQTVTVGSIQKVNAGSFKGYVALYAKGYAGQRMSAKVGKDWVVVPALASDFERVVEFTGAGVDVAVRIYIDRVLMDTINLTTK